MLCYLIFFEGVGEICVEDFFVLNVDVGFQFLIWKVYRSEKLYCDEKLVIFKYDNMNYVYGNIDSLMVSCFVFIDKCNFIFYQ